MIRSMTAFARQSTQFEWGSTVWEVRSVNHRYLEPSFKLPDTVRQLENNLRDALRNTLNRGKVECSLRIQAEGSSSSTRLSINDELLTQLVATSEHVQQQLRESAPINPLQLLQWPGVMTEARIDDEVICTDALSVFTVTLQQLLSSREREGAALKLFIEQRLESITHITNDIRHQMPIILKAQQQKLIDRIAQFAIELDKERLEQEIVMLAQKADVDEELDRLEAHIAEVSRVLIKGGPCGRRLDFLMQELNREANTLSSKSIVSDTTQAAVELKVLIEQMREQIQNIE